MPRIRTIKPEFWSSPDTAACEDPWARLLFIAMWNWADDHGRGTANPKELAGFAFPNDDKIDPADIRRMLGGIHRDFGVILYRVEGRPYYAIPSWEKHQKIDHRGKGRHPGPDEGEPWNPDPDGGGDQHKRKSSVDSTETPPRVHRDLGAGTGEQGNRGSKDLAAADASPESPAADAAPTVDDDFTDFWAAYPRKEKKPAALRAYKALRRKHTSHDTVMTGLRKHLAVWEQNGTQRQYIPHPATWLNNEAFNDDIGQTSLTVVPDLKTSFDEIRSDADAEYAGRLINRWYVEPAQPPSDTTPVHAWTRSRAVEFIDAHADEIRAALTPQRRTG